jgi:hypothetical protein
MAFAALFSAVASAVSYAPHTLLARALPANDSPPRYVWMPRSHAYQPPQAKGALVTTVIPDIGSRTSYGTARVLYTRLQQIEVHCWAHGGADDDPATAIGICEQMEAALLTGCRNLSGVNAYPTSAVWGTPLWSQLGITLVVTLDFVTAIQETDGALATSSDPATVVVGSANITDISFND